MDSSANGENLPSRQLADLKEDIDEVFSAFSVVLAAEEKKMARPSVRERENLAILRQHLKEPADGSLTSHAEQVCSVLQYSGTKAKGNIITGSDMGSVITRLTEQMEHLSQDLVKKVEESAALNREAESKCADLELKAENQQAELESLKGRLQKATEERKVANTLCETMQRQLEEKNKEMARLHREKNVQLWAREKKIVLKESAEREVSLTKEVEELRGQLKELRDRNRDRHQKMTEEVKREKMRADFLIRNASDKDDPIFKAEEAQRQLYITESRLAAACEEIKNQQKIMSGIMNGIKSDYVIIKSRWRDGQPHTEGEELEELLAVLYEAICSGTLDTVRADLDLNYQGLERDITGHTPKLASFMKKAKPGDPLPSGADNRVHLSPISTQTKEADKDMKASDQPVTPTTPGALELSSRVRRLSAKGRRIASVAAPPVFNSTSSQVDDIPEGAGQKNRASVARKASRADNNPQLVNPVTGLPNIREAVNLFPELNDAQVRVQFSRFMTYDKNSDYTLDREEVKEALMQIGDGNINEQDFKAAFSEIDTDGSGSVDFYEYLVLNRMLLHTGTGQSFKATKKIASRERSKACIMQ